MSHNQIMHVKDRTGIRYGNLVVIERASNSRTGSTRFRAICDCGNETIVWGDNLQSGQTTNCGCITRKNSSDRVVKMIPSGTRFGSLVILRRGENIGKFAGWVARCDCGNETLVSGPGLRLGNNKSCGCNYGNLNLNIAKCHALDIYKRSAKTRGFEWGVTDAEFFEIVAKPCHYCGEPPSNSIIMKGPRAAKIGGKFYYNGIDRMHNSKGYTLSNCVPCCFICNRAKMTMGYEDFVSWVHKASDHLRFSIDSEQSGQLIDIGAAIARHTP